MSRRGSAAAPRWTETAPVFAALGDTTRLRLVSRLSSDGPLSITRLCEGTEITRQAITKHLHALSEAGLVRDRRDGRERIWALEPAPLVEARRFLDDISAQWDVAIDRLRALV